MQHEERLFPPSLVPSFPVFSPPSPPVPPGFPSLASTGRSTPSRYSAKYHIASALSSPPAAEVRRLPFPVVPTKNGGDCEARLHGHRRGRAQLPQESGPQGSYGFNGRTMTPMTPTVSVIVGPLRWTRCAASRRIAAAVTGHLHGILGPPPVRLVRPFVASSTRVSSSPLPKREANFYCYFAASVFPVRARKLLRLHARYLCMFTTARSDNNEFSLLFPSDMSRALVLVKLR